MKVVILAGGFGTRISEETHLKPKPMIEIGGMPILWHIMKTYGHYGFTDFVLCCGYKAYIIKEYFSNYFLHTSDVTIDVANGSMEVHRRHAEPWRVTMVDTGLETMTGGRIKRVAEYLDGPFCMTYGDGLIDMDIGKLVEFHKAEGRLTTVTAVQPAARFGSVEMEGTQVTAFQEKPKGDGRWISGGFFVLEREVLDRIDGDPTIWEREPLEGLTADGQVSAYRHDGFWASMDTLRDKTRLEELWADNAAPWKVWD